MKRASDVPPEVEYSGRLPRLRLNRRGHQRGKLVGLGDERHRIARVELQHEFFRSPRALQPPQNLGFQRLGRPCGR